MPTMPATSTSAGAPQFDPSSWTPQAMMASAQTVANPAAVNQAAMANMFFPVHEPNDPTNFDVFQRPYG